MQGKTPVFRVEDEIAEAITLKIRISHLQDPGEIKGTGLYK